MLNRIALIDFPEPTGLNVNMMPFIFGDRASVPEACLGYWSAVGQCTLPFGSTCYLTITETNLRPGQHQRRPGIHTDGTCDLSWGGGWGGRGVFLASSDGRCRAWDEERRDVDRLGALLNPPRATPVELEPLTLYQVSDRTPHESLPARREGLRQFLRVVGPDVDGWWAEHSTANPLGVLPGCPILSGSKFAPPAETR